MKRLACRFFFVILLITIPGLCSLYGQDTGQAIYQLTTEADLLNESYVKEIDKFYNSGEEGYFDGQADIKIYYKIFRKPTADKAVLISAGRTEAAIKYKEVIFDLFNNGYAVFIHDHRGQGLSGRMTEDPEMGYIDDFQYYIDDMKYFFEQYIQPENYQNTYLLAHSMGGAIGMTYLEQHSNDFQAAAFSSPMLGLQPPTCNLIPVFDGNKPKYAIGQSAYKDSSDKFKGNTLTGSEIRYARMVQAFDEVPEARLGGATYTWVHKSCQQFEYLFNNMSKISAPFVLFSAEKEQIVHVKAHDNFIIRAQELGKNCQLVKIKDARHELLVEKDTTRDETLITILNFYSQY